jgi:hypothetical protein
MVPLRCHRGETPFLSEQHVTVPIDRSSGGMKNTEDPRQDVSYRKVSSEET